MSCKNDYNLIRGMPFKGVLVVSKVFATCNEINRLSKPLQSRFRKLFLPRYTEEKFLDVSEKVLTKLQLQLFRSLGHLQQGLEIGSVYLWYAGYKAYRTGATSRKVYS
jgi:hypothetical protein